MNCDYFFKSGRAARAGRARMRSAKSWRGVCARSAWICYNSSPYPRRLESFRLAVWRQGHLPLVGLGLLSEVQFISRYLIDSCSHLSAGHMSLLLKPCEGSWPVRRGVVYQMSEFAELNEGHPLGDDSREILCSPPIICKENQCPLKN